MSGLPREVLVWLQGLDLSYAITNPKRDFSNGFLVAEVVARYHPKLIRMESFDNSLKLSAKINNWEQLYKVFNKINSGVSKFDFDGVIHCAAGAAIILIMKLFTFFTRRMIDCPMPAGNSEDALPDFARPTASWALKDHELDRIEDTIIKAYHSIHALDMHNNKVAMYRYQNAGRLIASQRAAYSFRRNSESEKDFAPITGNVTEVHVKALEQGDVPAFNNNEGTETTGRPIKSMKPLRWAKSAAGCLESLQSTQAVFKACVDIVKPLILSVISEHLDSSKEPLTEFVELCIKESLDEQTCVKVLELLSQRASLLVDTCLKSPVELWKLWTMMMPLLNESADTSLIFESAIVFFKRLGDAMSETDGELTQQLFCGVGLPSLSSLLIKAPGKREAICEVFARYLVDSGSAHLQFLRELKNKIFTDACQGKNIPSQGSGLYIIILSYLVHTETFDESLLDLYLYYSVLGLQSVQAKVRIASLSILCSAALDEFPPARQAIINLTPHFSCLVHDRWWEVQAQIFTLVARVLALLPFDTGPNVISGVEDPNAANSAVNGGKASQTTTTAQATGTTVAADGSSISDPRKQPDSVETLLLHILTSSFHQNANKNALQVGLCSLVRVLDLYPQLIPLYVNVLVHQPPEMRRRLLSLSDVPPTRLAYVIGISSKFYEEVALADLWPSTKIATAAFEIGDVSGNEEACIEILLALFRKEDLSDVEKWLKVIEPGKKVLSLALVNPKAQKHAFEILRLLWENDDLMATSLEILEKPIVEALGRHPNVNTSTFWESLREHGKGGIPPAAERICKTFQASYPSEFEKHGFVL